jgi:DNA-binding GntR family transcriptional regulator
MTREPLRTPTTDTLADRAYRAVHDAITSGDLRPGQKVTERGLAERLSVSPTPVREAIRRLEQDGLIERTGPRTVVVATIGEAAVEDLAEVEIALRGLVARFAARHATPAQLDDLDAILDQADDLLIVIKKRHGDGQSVERHLTSLLDAVQRFNDAVNACASNPVLVRLLDQTKVFSRAERRTLLLQRVATDDQFGLDRYSSHRALVRALRAGDSAAAERIVMEDARGGLDALRADPRPSSPNQRETLAR